VCDRGGRLSLLVETVEPRGGAFPKCLSRNPALAAASLARSAMRDVRASSACCQTAKRLGQVGFAQTAASGRLHYGLETGRRRFHLPSPAPW